MLRKKRLSQGFSEHLGHARISWVDNQMQSLYMSPSGLNIGRAGLTRLIVFDNCHIT